MKAGLKEHNPLKEKSTAPLAAAVHCPVPAETQTLSNGSVPENQHSTEGEGWTLLETPF